MKRITTYFIIFLAAAFLCTSCAGRIQRRDENYAAYMNLKAEELKAQQKPLLTLKLTDEGKISGITMHAPPVPLKVQQYQRNYHPAWFVFRDVVKAAMPIGYIWATGDALSNLMKAGRGNQTITGSYNEAGRDVYTGSTHNATDSYRDFTDSHDITDSYNTTKTTTVTNTETTTTTDTDTTTTDSHDTTTTTDSHDTY